MDLSEVLLTVDYDHTLTDKVGAVPEANLEAISRFIARGGAFTINTGRSLPMLLPQIRRWGIAVNTPLLLYNGAMAYDLEAREIVFCSVLRQDPQVVLPELQTRFPKLLVEVQGLEAHYIFRDEPLWFLFGRENQRAGARIAYEELPDPFLKISIYGTFADGTVAQFYRMTPEEDREIREVEDWLARRFGDSVSVMRGCPRILDVQEAGVSKGTAARRLAERLGRGTLACVGDGTNDAAMLEEADLPFIPADAHASLLHRYKALCPCGEGTVADAIRTLEGM